METRAQRSSMAEIDVSNQSFGTETESSTMSREESIGFRLDRLEQTMEKQKEMWDKFFATVMARVQNLSNSRSSIAEVCEDALVALNQLQETTLEIQIEPENCVAEIIADSKQYTSPTMSIYVVNELMEQMDSIGEIDELQSQVHKIETVTFISPPIHDFTSDGKVKATGAQVQVPISAMESSSRLCTNTRFVLEDWSNDSMKNNQSQSIFDCDNGVYVSPVDKTGLHVKMEVLTLESTSGNHITFAHKLFDQMSSGITSIEKPLKSVKSWKFKFKNGYGKEGVQVYSSVRCDALNGCWLILGVEKLSREEVQKIDWESGENISSLVPCLSHYVIPFREISTLCARKSQFQDWINALYPSSTIGNSLDPTYIGNTNRAGTETLLLAPSPIDGQRLQNNGLYALVSLMVHISRLKVLVKECSRHMGKGLYIIQDELIKFGIIDNIREATLRHTSIGMCWLSLILLMQLLENRVPMKFSKSDYVEAQETLVELKKWLTQSPSILQASDCVIEMSRGKYSHYVAGYSETIFHFMEATKVTESKPMQATCPVFVVVSCLTLGDVESSSKAITLNGSLNGMLNSLSGVRKEASVLFVYCHFSIRSLVSHKESEIRAART